MAFYGLLIQLGTGNSLKHRERHRPPQLATVPSSAQQLAKGDVLLVFEVRPQAKQNRPT